MTSELFALREMTSADVPFIFNSWLKSYRDSPMVKSIPNTIYYNAHHAVIETLLKSPALCAWVACNPEDANQIYGYAIGEHFNGAITAVHWVYCKHPFRGNGIGSALMTRLLDVPVDPGHQTYYSHRVKNMEKLLGERQFIFNPYVLNRAA